MSKRNKDHTCTGTGANAYTNSQVKSAMSCCETPKCGYMAYEYNATQKACWQRQLRLDPKVHMHQIVVPIQCVC